MQGCEYFISPCHQDLLHGLLSFPAARSAARAPDEMPTNPSSENGEIPGASLGSETLMDPTHLAT